MKALVILLTGPFMLMFAVSALQTIEWNIENDTPVPFLAYVLLVAVAVWCVCAAKLRKSDIDELDNHKNK
ncbi:MAG: hypothetical protein PHO36_15610 [Parabacteroides sp.]|nr:hypothetical protein [Parabacteroides sp.]